MKYVVVALIAALAGAFIAREMWLDRSERIDPVQIMVHELKTHAIIEHERGVSVWYHACPEVVGTDPRIFMAWPARLSYELELGDVAIERTGDTLKVRTGSIRADEPSVPTDFLDYLATNPLFNFANEEQLVNAEIAKSSALARYLSAYFLLRDASLRADFEEELAQLVRHLAGALGVPVTRVEVEIAQEKVKLPKLPHVQLCEGSFALANGLPFARMEDRYTVPIRFTPPPSQRSRLPAPEERPAISGIASVYGSAGD